MGGVGGVGVGGHGTRGVALVAPLRTLVARSWFTVRRPWGLAAEYTGNRPHSSHWPWVLCLCCDCDLELRATHFFSSTFDKSRDNRGEGEGGPVGGEGEGGRLGLFSSPLPGLFSSPLPGLFSPLLPGTLGLITGASALKQTLGGHSRPEAVRTTRRRGDGGAPRRRRRAAFSRFDLPQLLLLNSTCELARAAGVGVLSGGVCERARREISFARARWVG